MVSIVDTCFLIDLIREDPGAMQFAEDEPVLRTTSISAAEFLFGAKINTRPGILDAARMFLTHFPILPFDTKSSDSLRRYRCRAPTEWQQDLIV